MKELALGFAAQLGLIVLNARLFSELEPGGGRDLGRSFALALRSASKSQVTRRDAFSAALHLMYLAHVEELVSRIAVISSTLQTSPT